MSDWLMVCGEAYRRTQYTRAAPEGAVKTVNGTSVVHWPLLGDALHLVRVHRGGRRCR